VPRYIIERLFDQTKERLEPATAERAKRVMREDFPDMIWEHSHVAIEDGPLVRTFCIYSAANEDDIRKHAQRTSNHEILNIYELSGDTRPEDVSALADSD
jgi:uncharacterized protein DUF4242